jgi:hypothetical protein
VKFLSGLLIAVVAFIGVGAVVGEAFVQPASASSTLTVISVNDCVATGPGGCSVDQELSLEILPPGSTPPPTTAPPTTPPVTTPPPVDPGPGGGRQPVAGPPPKNLPKTGPRETAIMAAVGLGVLQLGLIMAVRAGRAQRAGRLAA